MIILDRFVDMLVDGEWHSLAPIFKTLGLCKRQRKAIISILKELKAIDIENGEVKLNEPFLSFIRTSQTSED